MDDAARSSLSKALLGRPQFEAGVGVGYGQTYAPENYTNIDSHKTDKSAVLQAYLLARNPWVGAEIGHMKLPEYHSRSYTGDYPAYKQLPAGTYPQTVSGQQDITASGNYARLNAYGPKVFGAEPYGFYGRMRVKSDNHEQATYNGTDRQELRQPNLTKNAAMYGLGAQVPLSSNSYLRAELGRIPHATKDYHTLDRDVTYGLLGLGAQF